MTREQRAVAATLRPGDPVRGTGWTLDGTYGGFVGTLTYAAMPVFVATTETGQRWRVDISETRGYRQWISPR